MTAIDAEAASSCKIASRAEVFRRRIGNFALALRTSANEPRTALYFLTHTIDHLNSELLAHLLLRAAVVLIASIGKYDWKIRPVLFV